MRLLRVSGELPKALELNTNTHSEHIRAKLGITNNNANMTTYLHTFMAE
jgi:hypothetical protein